MAGMSIDIRIAIIAITTSNSTSVNASQRLYLEFLMGRPIMMIHLLVRARVAVMRLRSPSLVLQAAIGNKRSSQG